MKKILFLLLIVVIFSCKETTQKTNYDFTTKFEKSKGTETTTYLETIAYFKELDNAYPEISMLEIGETDSGNPLNLVVFNSDKEFDFNKINKSKNVILINNDLEKAKKEAFKLVENFIK